VGQVIAVDTSESVIYNEADGLIATLGVSDLVIVRSGSVTFVAHKSRVNQIRNLVQQVSSEYSDLT
jgi:hypothetical protein